MVRDLAEQPDGVVLTPAQRRAVSSLRGPVLLQAPVGTGKTLTLAERAAHAVAQGVPAHRILCVTFTNRAAEELRERVRLRCGPEAQEMTVTTFHSLCARILREEAEVLGLPRDFLIYDEDDGMAVMADLCREGGIGNVGSKEARWILQQIEHHKANVPEEELVWEQPLARIYQEMPAPVARWATAYQAVLHRNGALDFADLIYWVRVLFRDVPEARRRWAERFQLVQVDEAQDTHLSEYEVLRILAEGSGNLALVGDLQQTIYEFRGSRPQEVLARFEQDFGPPLRLSLRENHRTTRTLLAAASAVGARLVPPMEAPLVPGPSARQGEPIVVYAGWGERDEADWIARRLQAEQAAGTPWSRMAVLTRTNRRATVISEVLEALAVPHVKVEQYHFFRRQEVKDALAWLRFLLHPYDTYSLRRLLLRPRRGVGEATWQRVMEAGSTAAAPPPLPSLPRLRLGAGGLRRSEGDQVAEALADEACRALKGLEAVDRGRGLYLQGEGQVGAGVGGQEVGDGGDVHVTFADSRPLHLDPLAAGLGVDDGSDAHVLDVGREGVGSQLAGGVDGLFGDGKGVAGVELNA